MAKFNFSAYDYSDSTPNNMTFSSNQLNSPTPVSQPKEEVNAAQKQKTKFDFSAYDPQAYPEEPKEEGWGEWAARTALQIPKGIAQATTYPLDLLQQIGYADATDPEEIDRIRQASERVGKPFDEEAYLAKANEAASMFTNVDNASRYLRDNYGIPLEAQTRLQKFVNFASSARKIAPKGATLRPLNVSLPKPMLGTGVAATAEVAKELGVNETLADLGSFAILKTPKAGSPSLSFGKKTKPSGLSERYFENVKADAKVSERTIEKINSEIENEFRTLTEKIISDTPLAETRKGLQNNIKFKENASKAFQEVEKLAESLPGTIPRDKIKSKYNVKIGEINPKGFAASEYEKSLYKNLTQAKKDIAKKNISTVDLVDQFRKNNNSFGKIKEPGSSFAVNQAKRDALVIQNKAIAQAIEEMRCAFGEDTIASFASYIRGMKK